MKYRIEQPEKINSNIDTLINKLNEAEEVQKYLDKTTSPEYLYWDKVKYIPHPNNMTVREFWEIVKLLRKNPLYRRISVIRTEKNENFTWQDLPGIDSFCHEADMQLGGNLTSVHGIEEKEKYRFIRNGVMEEAIASSQLEGAVTTRKVAKKMIREKRKPKNKFEQMIINNFNAMMTIEEKLKNVPLSNKILFSLHEQLTKETLKISEIGRFRKDSDNIVVSNIVENKIYHKPPSEKFLKKEIKRFIDFANDKNENKLFIHPIIKAIIIHFWVGYLHPFTDGNGRLARALFYWYLLRHNYWAFSYLPLSKIIRNSPAQYRDAYVYTEQDDLDLTYFIDYNIRKIKQAKKDFENHVKRQKALNMKMTKNARKVYKLNDRQIQALRYLYKNKDESTLINTYKDIFNVSRLTARNDLYKLKELELLTSKKIGKYVHFYATEKVNELFE